MILGDHEWRYPFTWMRSSWDRPACVSRQLETIFSGNRECWGERSQEPGSEGPSWGSGYPSAQTPSPTLTGELLNSSYLAKFFRKTKRLSPPMGQAACTSTTDSWSSKPRSGVQGKKQGSAETSQASQMSHLPNTTCEAFAFLSRQPPFTPTHPVPDGDGTPPAPSFHHSRRELAAPAFHTRSEL